MHMKTVHILGIPMDLGQQRRGVDMGPSAIRYAGLHDQIKALGFTATDHGNLVVPNPEESIAQIGDNRLQAVAQVCSKVFEWGQEKLSARQNGSSDVTIFLGGDHSISIGSIKATAVQNPAKTGVIWIDAHADFNTPTTSPSGNIHGMPVAVLTGDGPEQLTSIGASATDGQVNIPANNIVQIGIRDVDQKEAVRVCSSELKVYTMSEIDGRGMAAVAAETLTYLSHCERIHVSLDLDCLDPSQAPGVGTPVKGGLAYREAHLLAEILGDSGKIRSIDVVEVNPILDEKNVTAEVAVELVASFLGKKIL